MLFKILEYFILSVLAIVFVCVFGFFAWIGLCLLFAFLLIKYVYVNFIKKPYLDDGRQND